MCEGEGEHGVGLKKEKEGKSTKEKAKKEIN